MKAVDTNVLARFFVDDPHDPQAVRQRPAALAAMRGRVDFADALHLVRARGCEALLTFDKRLIRRAAALDGTLRCELPAQSL